MTELSIVDATDDHIFAITRLYADVVRTGTASYEEEPPLAEEMAERRRRVVELGLPYLVALTSEGVTGFAHASPFRSRPGYRHTVEDTVYVAPDSRRRGVGRALLQTLIARCRALGRRQMVAVIGDGANKASIALHQSCGFRHVGTLDAIGYKFDRFLDLVIMQRALGD